MCSAQFARQPDSQTAQYYAIDIVRFIMAVCVIAIHTHPFWDYEKTSFWFPYYQTFISNAVPFFFITSSFLLFKKYFAVSIASTEEASKILWKYVKHMTVLYLGWSIIYLPLAIIGYWTKHVFWWKAIIFYIRDFFLVGEHFYSWPLWYLLSTIYSALVVYWLLKKGWKKINLLILSIIVFFIAKFITSFVSGIETYVGIEYYIAKAIALTILNGRLMTGLFYFVVGMCFADSKCLDKIKPCFCMLIWFVVCNNYKPKIKR